MKKHPEEGHRLLVEGRGSGQCRWTSVCTITRRSAQATRTSSRATKSASSPKWGRCVMSMTPPQNRPYKAGWDPAESIQKMAQWTKDGHFDERIFQAFVRASASTPSVRWSSSNRAAWRS